jgi:hypothetical protein
VTFVTGVGSAEPDTAAPAPRSDVQIVTPLRSVLSDRSGASSISSTVPIVLSSAVQLGIAFLCSRLMILVLASIVVEYSSRIIGRSCKSAYRVQDQEKRLLCMHQTGGRQRTRRTKRKLAVRSWSRT